MIKNMNLPFDSNKIVKVHLYIHYLQVLGGKKKTNFVLNFSIKKISPSNYFSLSQGNKND